MLTWVRRAHLRIHDEVSRRATRALEKRNCVMGQIEVRRETPFKVEIRALQSSLRAKLLGGVSRTRELAS